MERAYKKIHFENQSFTAKYRNSPELHYFTAYTVTPVVVME